MNSDRIPVFSKTFEISFIVTLAIFGLLISLAIWSTRQQTSPDRAEFEQLGRQIRENQQEIKTEITALNTKIDNKFSVSYTNQQRIAERVDNFRSETNNKLDKLNQRLSNLVSSLTGAAASE